MDNLLDNDVFASIGTQKYYVEVRWRNGTLIMDEPESLSGQDLGPDPYTTLLASLAGCTLSTLRMYISRKEWDIPEIRVALNMYQSQDPLHTTIKRDISFPNLIDEDIKKRLLLIAQKCPVSKILENKITINTSI
ncbi:OsmC family protein [Eisenibacter elegans]|uniref:OsmC family protein n=1 Tax=Eisenibacter elegans TaxID=997 RepID=UPI00042064CD|nr:OsmC family protein [Eisenibacter elegans]